MENFELEEVIKKFFSLEKDKRGDYLSSVLKFFFNEWVIATQAELSNHDLPVLEIIDLQTIMFCGAIFSLACINDLQPSILTDMHYKNLSEIFPKAKELYKSAVNHLDKN